MIFSDGAQKSLPKRVLQLLCFLHQFGQHCPGVNPLGKHAPWKVIYDLGWNIVKARISRLCFGVFGATWKLVHINEQLNKN